MSKIKLTKRCYTTPDNVRTVTPGIYNLSDFSKEELTFLTKLNAVKFLEKKKVETEVEEDLEKPVYIVETKLTPPTSSRKRKISKSKE